jgi:putative thioredoxin
MALAVGASDEVLARLDAIPTLADEADAARSLRQALELAEECKNFGGEQGCRARLQENPADLDARFALAACMVGKSEYRDALQAFLEIVAKDRKHRDEAARKAMLTVFGIVGVRSDLANEFRRKLAIYL